MSDRTSKKWRALGRATGGLLLLSGCSEGYHDLAYLPDSASSSDGAGAAFPESIGGSGIESILRVVNERPLGAASLSGGTRGGGTFEQAFEDGAWTEVESADELVGAVAGDSPSIVLIHPGVYDLGEPEPYPVEACSESCPEGARLPSELRPGAECPTSASLTSTTSRMRRLKVGSNKTLLGLGAGASLRNVQLDLSGSQQVILRNLAISEVNPGLVGSGNAIVMWPSQHVWVDHCSLSSASHTLVNIHSTWDQESSGYPLVDTASHITLSYNLIDGSSEHHCSGMQTWGVGTQRNPALTLHHNLIRAVVQGAPYLFGAETWGHVFNNLIESTQSYAVGVACGARGLVEANVFQDNRYALRVSDDGLPTWPFCAEGLFGRAWFPVAAGVSANIVEPASAVQESERPVDGDGLELPEAAPGGSVVSVPLPGGNESYVYPLEAVSSSWAEALVSRVGVGKLF